MATPKRVLTTIAIMLFGLAVAGLGVWFASIGLEAVSRRLTVPVACVLERSGKGQGVIQLVRGGKVARVKVELGTDNGTLVVSGRSTGPAPQPGPLATAATVGYRRFVVRETAHLLAGTRDFSAAVEHGDLARAKALFGPVRFYYE